MIFFVGAGPGAVDLITVRGQELLKNADTIVYAGSLVNPELLKLAKKECELFDSAKLTLEEVMDIMIPRYRALKMVVRLHTGDPSIYGAIKEKMDILEQKNVIYEVVPGVSSFLAAASSLKAEYTLPGISQTIIITRMEGRTPVPKEEEIELLAAHGGTMVIFLSASMLEKLQQKLLTGGYTKETPVAIVYKASWKDEIVLRTTVEHFPRIARENNISKTTLILVGGFLGNEYARSLLYHPEFSHEFREAKTE